MMTERTKPGQEQDPGRRKYEIVNVPFWRGAIPLLRQHDTELLERRAIDIARHCPLVSMPDFHKANAFAKEVHADELRDLTGTPYSNHLYKVFILSTMIAGRKNITNEGAQIALLHDTVENTATTPDDLFELTGSEDVPLGVFTLSHRIHGEDILKDDADRAIYHGGIARLDLFKPRLNVGPIKGADQAHNGSDPLTIQEILDPTPERVELWRRKSEDKAEQMEKLANMFRAAGTSNMAAFLDDGAAFTRARLDPEYDGFPNNILRR